MKIKDMMCTDIQLITPSTMIAEAARLMRDCDCGYLPVGENNRLTGAITDRDIVVRALAEGMEAESTPIHTIMSNKIQYCYEDDEVKDASQRMKDLQIRRLAVLNRDKQLVGIVSLGDIARKAKDHHLTGEIEEKVVKAA